MLEWIGLSPAAIWWIVIVSASMFALALLAVPLFVVHIPADYFAYPHRSDVEYPRRYSWFRWIWLIAKNMLAVGFLFFGALMLVLPGQGILTIFIGITLLDFPGKFKLQQWIVSRRGVLDSINWLREKVGKEPLVLGHWT